MNNNGHISFDEPVSQYNPEAFPIYDLALIAPYWADADTRPLNGGWVWYRVSTDDGLKTRATQLIQSTFSSQDLFTPEYLVIATWDHVGYYPLQTNMVTHVMLLFQRNNVKGISLKVGIGV